ncbi:hypothetical protein K504DRAFT_126411 [Pleomassaria siparia CBS 279.74]|uniref:Uncharacterized protein n=1 Tax=Pleomassaria siparia CBS 279.74 TaxID=1314801 RepID=A0A6G1KJG0_9PLEO|nr:hypothetical protein K504DRAFT_126411 [Pleomassaria siparia CBS 279.74]
MAAKRNPIITLVNILPKTPYSNDADKSDKSDGYFSAQNTVVVFLQRYPSDILSALDAYSLTSYINPRGTPAPEDALRLCFYMRSLGFETYCRMKPKDNCFALYVANGNFRDDEDRGTQHDECYWEQNFKTGKVQDVFRYHSRMRGAATRPESDEGWDEDTEEDGDEDGDTTPVQPHTPVRPHIPNQRLLRVRNQRVTRAQYERNRLEARLGSDFAGSVDGIVVIMERLEQLIVQEAMD